jgi:hypothetical protein
VTHPMWFCDVAVWFKKRREDDIKQRKENALASGKCARCYKRPLITKTCCAQCRDKVMTYHTSASKKALSIGKCVRCKTRDLLTKTFCSTCAELHRAEQREHHRNLKGGLGGAA